MSGFDDTANTSPPSEITTKLGDLGIVMAPATGSVQPIAYRAPEVYFRLEITPAADIWSWGLIYCHLLEAQHEFGKRGMYDDHTNQRSIVESMDSVMKDMSHDYDLRSYNYYKDTPLPLVDESHKEGRHWRQLTEKGVPKREVGFLKWVLNPDPTQRPTAQQILDSGWLGTEDGHEVSVGSLLESSRRSRSASVLSGKPSIRSSANGSTNEFEEAEHGSSTYTEYSKSTVQGLVSAIGEYLGRTPSKESRRMSQRTLDGGSLLEPDYDFEHTDQLNQFIPADDDKSAKLPTAKSPMPAPPGLLEILVAENPALRIHFAESSPVTQLTNRRDSVEPRADTTPVAPWRSAESSAEVEPFRKAEEIAQSDEMPVQPLAYQTREPIAFEKTWNATPASKTDTQTHENQQRPGMPSRNTGTFLSYKSMVS